MESSELSLRHLSVVSDEEVLRTRLKQTVERKELQDVSVGVSLDGRKIVLRATESDGQINQPTVVAGCLAKVVTATLIAETIVAGRLHWDQPVTDILALDAKAMRRLRGIEVRHLVNHAHGVDDSALKGIPRKANGFIDSQCLCSALSAGFLFAPGEMYSYGELGAWLAGAVLETIHNKPYASLLREQGLMVDRSHEAPPSAICPATGMDLAMTIEQWLELAERYIGIFRDPLISAQPEFHLPGWHPSERGINGGWKDYGAGWSGHNSNLNDRSAILRVNPRERTAIVVAASGCSGALFAFAGIFADLLPELFEFRPPKLLKLEAVPKIQADRYVGLYCQFRTAVEVDLLHDSVLRIAVYERQSGRAFSSARRFLPAEGGLFLADSRGDPEFLFVQFLSRRASGGSEFLWNGRQVWRRAGCCIEFCT